MTTTQLTIVCLTVLASLLAVLRARHLSQQATLADGVRARELAHFAALRDLPPVTTGDRVTVHTTDDRSLHGVIVAEAHGRLRLGDAQVVTAQGKLPVPGGVVSIPSSSEAFRQEHEVTA